MPPSPVDTELRLIARQRIASGELPARPGPSRVFGGYGTGRLCDLCRKPISADEIEYEFEHGADPAMTIRFHFVCQSAWQLEIVRASGAA